jgi:hypothetical protein
LVEHLLAMQKVEGSSPFIRSKESPAKAGFSVSFLFPFLAEQARAVADKLVDMNHTAISFVVHHTHRGDQIWVFFRRFELFHGSRGP